MMEIPAGKWCEGCAWRYLALHTFEDECMNPDLVVKWIESDRPEECLAAYPNGATIEIKPKEVHL